ncbi:hypothetical protein GALMADRAFT_256724 [Galerina marginata CBS 339.88]|uniref:Uncharacterized protein n=1 Tax=Galerina marginata (strain CBS 339.88) TaxID=685588 RepID=A0A067SEU2_GALM3|nr:hypothetical protein GALMADRAFT_256724 [Galerina marginata CBS 339.88]
MEDEDRIPDAHEWMHRELESFSTDCVQELSLSPGFGSGLSNASGHELDGMFGGATSARGDVGIQIGHDFGHRHKTSPAPISTRTKGHNRASTSLPASASPASAPLGPSSLALTTSTSCLISPMTTKPGSLSQRPV